MNNQRGTILQIVLVIFMILSITILSISKILIDNARALHRMKQLNTSRIMELSFIYECKKDAESDTLFSGVSYIEGYMVTYNVETIENKYYVHAIVEIFYDTYSFDFVLCQDTLRIEMFTYH